MATLQRRFSSNKGKQVRRNTAGTKQGSGDDVHMLAGSSGSGSTEFLYRSLVGFGGVSWTGMKRILKIELFVRTYTTSTHFSCGNTPATVVHRLTQSFSDGTNGENVWTAGEYAWPLGVSGPTFKAPVSDGKPVNAAWVPVDITDVMAAVVSKGIPVGLAGKVGLGQTFYGLLLRAAGDEKNDHYRMIFSSFDRSGSAYDPYIMVTYDSANNAPTAPTLTGPALTDVSFGDSFSGTHHDPDLDPMSARLIEVWPKGKTPAGARPAGVLPAWELPTDLQTAGSDEVLTGTFSVPLSLAVGSLKLQTDYDWRAATKDPAGALGAFSAVRALRITSSAPTVVATDVGAVAAMSGALFGGSYLDSEGDPMAAFSIQLKGLEASHSDALWVDEAQLLWTTGETFPSADEVTAKKVARPYAGNALPVGNYTYRFRAKDSTGAWSAWAYDDFNLTTAYVTEPGLADLTTQLARNAPVRIALFKMGPLRAPGALIGYVDDPMDLGTSVYLNGAGELYFTLPALHPYCPEIEPHQTHYQVQQWYGDRYRTLFAGIITDFDATTDEAIFYGADYLGLLQTAVDERFNEKIPEQPANGAGGGGSYYSNKTIDYIIRDQLQYHKAAANSPVGFITIPATGASFSPLVEQVTIPATYAECLPFISGVIDSHKQGTGREARFYARPKDTTFLTWEWALIDNWGKDRPNIRLEYGGLLNDFRIVALGDFGTRVLAVGQKRNEVKVYRAVGVGGLSEAQWGRRAKTAFYQDIADQGDLQRRANEAANVLSKIGKRMALAIRADMLAPLDGWDVGDSIVIDIVRGVVDTSLYGSGGLWTIYGVEWRYFPDGHTELTLTILPKKGTAAPGYNSTIKTISKANPTQITTTVPHNLVTGQQVTISGSNSTPSVNGTYTVTVIDDDTFTIPVNVTTAGTAGNVNASVLIPSINPGVSVDFQTGHGVPVSYGLPAIPTPP